MLLRTFVSASASFYARGITGGLVSMEILKNREIPSQAVCHCLAARLNLANDSKQDASLKANGTFKLSFGKNSTRHQQARSWWSCIAYTVSHEISCVAPVQQLVGLPAYGSSNVSLLDNCLPWVSSVQMQLSVTENSTGISGLTFCTMLILVDRVSHGAFAPNLRFASS